MKIRACALFLIAVIKASQSDEIVVDQDFTLSDKEIQDKDFEPAGFSRSDDADENTKLEWLARNIEIDNKKVQTSTMSLTCEDVGRINEDFKRGFRTYRPLTPGFYEITYSLKVIFFCLQSYLRFSVTGEKSSALYDCRNDDEGKVFETGIIQRKALFAKSNNNEKASLFFNVKTGHCGLLPSFASPLFLQFIRYVIKRVHPPRQSAGFILEFDEASGEATITKKNGLTLNSVTWYSGSTLDLSVYAPPHSPDDTAKAPVSHSYSNLGQQPMCLMVEAEVDQPTVDGETFEGVIYKQAFGINNAFCEVFGNALDEWTLLGQKPQIKETDMLNPALVMETSAACGKPAASSSMSRKLDNLEEGTYRVFLSLDEFSVEDNDCDSEYPWGGEIALSYGNEELDSLSASGRNCQYGVSRTMEREVLQGCFRIDDPTKELAIKQSVQSCTQARASTSYLSVVPLDAPANFTFYTRNPEEGVTSLGLYHHSNEPLTKIDWGDGSVTENPKKNQHGEYFHQYSRAGLYTFEVFYDDPSSGCPFSKKFVDAVKVAKTISWYFDPNDEPWTSNLGTAVSPNQDGRLPLQAKASCSKSEGTLMSASTEVDLTQGYYWASYEVKSTNAGPLGCSDADKSWAMESYFSFNGEKLAASPEQGSCSGSITDKDQFGVYGVCVFAPVDGDTYDVELGLQTEACTDARIEIDNVKFGPMDPGRLRAVSVSQEDDRARNGGVIAELKFYTTFDEKITKIDWGDGTDNTLNPWHPAFEEASVVHTYSEKGVFTITIDYDSGPKWSTTKCQLREVLEDAVVVDYPIFDDFSDTSNWVTEASEQGVVRNEFSSGDRYIAELQTQCNGGESAYAEASRHIDLPAGHYKVVNTVQRSGGNSAVDCSGITEPWNVKSSLLIDDAEVGSRSASGSCDGDPDYKDSLTVGGCLLLDEARSVQVTMDHEVSSCSEFKVTSDSLKVFEVQTDVSIYPRGVEEGAEDGKRTLVVDVHSEHRVLSIMWGDGTVSEHPTPEGKSNVWHKLDVFSHTYDAPGTYSIAMEAIDKDYGCPVTVVEEVSVRTQDDSMRTEAPEKASCGQAGDECEKNTDCCNNDANKAKKRKVCLASSSLCGNCIQNNEPCVKKSDCCTEGAKCTKKKVNGKKQKVCVKKKKKKKTV